MEEWMEKILQDLNRMSRVAVIEQAFDVESMLRNYAKILKYRWSHIDKEVPIQMEYIHLDMLLAYYRIQFNKQLIFEMQLEPSVKGVMIPHYTLMSIVGSILEGITFTVDGKVNCRVSTAVLMKEEIEQAQRFLISIQFEGNVDFKEVLVCSQNVDVSYESLGGACARWKQAFSDADVELSTDEKNALSIQLYGSIAES